MYSRDFFKKLELFEEWRKKQQDFSILEEPNGTLNNILVRCSLCGAEQKRSPESLYSGVGCQVCETKQGIRKTPKQFNTELLEKYGGEYLPVEDYKSSRVPILIKHTVCGKIFLAKPCNILMDKGGKCPVCRKQSRGERRIRVFLQRHQIAFEEQKRFDGFRKYPYDFWLPDYNLLIEFQGRQHYEPIKLFGGEKTFLHQQEIDNTKRIYAEQHGYEFLSIKYTFLPDIEDLLAQRLSVRSSENETIVISNGDKDIV